MRVSTVLGAIFAASLAALPTLIAPDRAAADTCSEIVIGAALSLTGAHATGGIHTRNGYEFAVGQIRARGGIKVGDKCVQLRVIYYDAESSPRRAADLARRLITKDHVRFLLGPYDTEAAVAIASVAEAHKTPLVTAHALPLAALSPKHPYVFGTLLPIDYDLSLAVDVAAKIAANTGRSAATVKIAITAAPEFMAASVRQSVVDRALHYDMSVIHDEKLLPEPVAMRTSFDKIKRDGADVLLVSGGADGASLALRQIEDMQIRVPMVVMTHCRAADLAQRFKKAAQNILCATRPRISPQGTNDVFVNATKFEKAFIAQFKDYEVVPDEVTNAATAIHVYAKALERGGSRENEKIRAQLAATDIATLHGRLSFSGGARGRTGFERRRMILSQIVDGAYRPIVLEDPSEHRMGWPRAGL